MFVVLYFVILLGAWHKPELPGTLCFRSWGRERQAGEGSRAGTRPRAALNVTGAALTKAAERSRQQPRF